MASPLPVAEVLLSDPLGPAARGERRNLLAGSVFTFLVTVLHLEPEKIGALGIDLVGKIQHLALVFAAVMLYFLITFLFFAFADVLARLNAFLELETAQISDEQRLLVEKERRAQEAKDKRVQWFLANTYGARNSALQILADRYPDLELYKRVSRRTAVARAVVDIIISAVLGVLSFFWLWRFAKPWEGISVIDWDATTLLLVHVAFLGVLLFAIGAEALRMRQQRQASPTPGVTPPIQQTAESVAASDTSRITDSVDSRVVRGDTSMAILFGTWGVTTVATGLLLQLSEAARGYKTVLMVGDYLVLTYLCFWNTWLRNRLIQYSVRIRTEKHA